MSKRVYTAEEKAQFAAMMKARRAKAKKAGGNRPIRVSRQVQYKSQTVHVEECSQSYLLALLNPYESYGACIPSSFPLKSQKVHAYMRGSLALGTGGVGYVIARGTAVNDSWATKSTTSSSVGTGATVLNSFTLITTTNMTKLPYTTADVTAGNVQSRIVSMGLRVRYTGREDARNGTVASVESPDHEDLALQTPDAINNYESLERVRPPEDWVYVNYSGPVSPSNIEFSSDAHPLGTSYILSHIITGVAGDIYDYEFYQNIEYIGRSSVGKTQNHVDEIGYGKIQQVVKGAASEGPITPAKSRPIADRVVQAIGNSIPGILDAGRRILGIMNLDPASILRQAIPMITSHFNPMSQLGGGGTMRVGGARSQTTKLLGF